MELETVNKLYLELSQIATARTAKEIYLESQLPGRDEMILSALVLGDLDGGKGKITKQLQNPDGFELEVLHANGMIKKVEVKITDKENEK